MDGTPYAGMEDIGMALLEDSAELLDSMLLEDCSIELLVYST